MWMVLLILGLSLSHWRGVRCVVGFERFFCECLIVIVLILRRFRLLSILRLVTFKKLLLLKNFNTENYFLD